MKAVTFMSSLGWLYGLGQDTGQEPTIISIASNVVVVVVDGDVSMNLCDFKYL